MRSLILLHLFLSLLVSPAFSIRVGGWRPIEDIDDTHVKEIAEYAIFEYNKGQNTLLTFSRVVKGETQVVAGVNYRLLVQVKGGEDGSTMEYEVVVWEKPWLKFMQLTSFKPIEY
ncbi:hypothetical protein Cni_G04177 [Canna indica]|uniref:Cystatin domain-containing protein n=1 Tax=Canna indica TaxID=4628 RepID=A0AAQ3Q3R0_9LILI|nr:hypothetical protein Cni_G04177 [Canna indica]